MTTTSSSGRLSLASAMDEIRIQLGKKAIGRADWSRHLQALPVGKPLEVSDASGAYAEMLGHWSVDAPLTVVGDPTTGKSTLAYATIGSHLGRSDGNRCLLLDPDGTFSAAYGAALGLDLRRVARSRARNADHIVWIAKMMLATGAISLVVLDSRSAIFAPPTLANERGRESMSMPVSDQLAELCAAYGALFLVTELTTTTPRGERIVVDALDGTPDDREARPGLSLRFELDPENDEVMALGDDEPAGDKTFELPRPLALKVMYALLIEAGHWAEQDDEDEEAESGPKISELTLDEMVEQGFATPSELREALDW